MRQWQVQEPEVLVERAVYAGVQQDMRQDYEYVSLPLMKTS